MTLFIRRNEDWTLITNDSMRQPRRLNTTTFGLMFHKALPNEQAEGTRCYPEPLNF